MIEMVPRTKRDIVVTTEVTTEAVSRKDEVINELQALRKEWVTIGPLKRSGKTGDSLMKKYRRLALEHWHLTGNHPPPIYDEL